MKKSTFVNPTEGRKIQLIASELNSFDKIVWECIPTFMFWAFNEAQGFFPTASSFAPRPPAGVVLLGRIAVPVPISILETRGGPASPLRFSRGVPLPPSYEPPKSISFLEGAPGEKKWHLEGPGPSKLSSRLRRGSIFTKTSNPWKNTKMTKSCPKTDPGGVWKITLASPKIDVLPAWELNFKHFRFFMIFEGSLEIAILPAWELNFRENCPHIFYFSIT